jgi:ADP-heptose:LPS heptosyltransferase
MRILFNSLTYFGDVVLSTGLLGQLVDSYPEARFTIACGKAAAPLLTEVPRLERLIPITKKKASLHWLDIWLPAAPHVWDIVLDLKGSSLAYLLMAKKRLVFWPRHATGAERTTEWAHLLGLEQLPTPRVWIGERHDAQARALLGDGPPVIAIGPTASWAPKMWPGDRFAELCMRLTAPDGILPGARIAFLGTKEDTEKVPGLYEGLPQDRIIDLFGRTDLLTAAAVIKHAAFYIGNDSGPLHLSVAVDTPGLGLVGPSPGLFGPPDPPYVAPWAKKIALARTTLSFEEMISAPDYDRHTVGNLMGTLTVDAAEEAARELWRRCGGNVEARS